jgi:opacity protein-like surface antigen
MLLSRFTAISFLALSLVVSSVSHASDEGAYIGASIGGSRTNIDFNGATTSKESDTTYKLSAGYKFNKNVAAELSYADLGHVSGSDSSVSIKLKTKQVIELSAIGIAPISDQAALTGRLGVYSADVEGYASMGGSWGQKTETSTGAVIGIGLNYQTNKINTLKGDLSLYKNVELGSFKYDINTFTVGVNYKF